MLASRRSRVIVLGLLAGGVTLWGVQCARNDNEEEDQAAHGGYYGRPFVGGYGGGGGAGNDHSGDVARKGFGSTGGHHSGST
ncbi:MAG TPA: hypothetical protein VGB55_05325 [Tepidisphaeraceae bacterium]|jgi:hypothetical protein